MANDDEVEAVARAIHGTRYPANAWGMVEPIAASFFKAEARAAIAALDAVRASRKAQTCPRAPHPFRYCPDCTGGNDCAMTPAPEDKP